MSQLIRLTDLLPDYYDGVYEMHELTAVEQPQLDELQRIVDQVEANEFISIADSQGLSIFEKMYGLKAANGDSIEMRRFRLLMFLSMYRPYTMRYLREVLLSLDPKSTVKLINDRYQLVINTQLEKQGEMAQLDTFLNQILPANLVLEMSNNFNGKSTGNIFMASGIVPTEMVTITQDYNDSTEIKSIVKMSNADIPTLNQIITGDYIGSVGVQSTILTANVNVPTMSQLLTADYHDSSSIKNDSDVDQRQVITEIVEIN